MQGLNNRHSTITQFFPRPQTRLIMVLLNAPFVVPMQLLQDFRLLKVPYHVEQIDRSQPSLDGELGH